jgi:hypothetical protein
MIPKPWRWTSFAAVSLPCRSRLARKIQTSATGRTFASPKRTWTSTSMARPSTLAPSGDRSRTATATWTSTAPKPWRWRLGSCRLLTRSTVAPGRPARTTCIAEPTTLPRKRWSSTWTPPTKRWSSCDLDLAARALNRSCRVAPQGHRRVLRLGRGRRARDRRQRPAQGRHRQARGRRDAGAALAIGRAA